MRTMVEPRVNAQAGLRGGGKVSKVIVRGSKVISQETRARNPG